MTYNERIEIDPSVCDGQPVIRGTRIAVAAILNQLGRESLSEASEKPSPILRTTIFVRRSSSLAIQSTAPGASTQGKQARPLTASDCRRNGDGYNRTPISCAASSVSGSWWTPPE